MPRPPRDPPALRNAILAILVVWAGVGYLRSLEDALAGLDRRESRGGPPLTWRLGKAPVRDLGRCLDAARPRLPAGAVVAFAGPADPGGQWLLRWRWAAYLLPEHDLVPYRGAETPGAAGWVVACRAAPAGDRRLVEVARLPGGRLYRVREGVPREGGR